MRLFIALELATPHVEWLVEYQRLLKNAVYPGGGHFRWTTPEQWHITLQFLGECAENNAPSIVTAIKDVAATFSLFRLSLASLGAFGGRRGGVLWLGVAEGKESLESLSAELQKKLAGLGFKLEKRAFRGHVTLARSRSKLTSSAIRKLPIPAQACPVAFVDGLTLFESKLSSQGAHYERLAQGTFAK